MALDFGDYNRGDDGMPEKSKLSIRGAYIDSSGSGVVYVASGKYNGVHVGLPEDNLMRAFQSADAGKADVALWSSKPKTPDFEPDTLSLTVNEIQRSLDEINRVAPADRPNPMAAVG